MRPTIMICFVSTRLFPKQPPWHTTFELRERKSGILFSDQSAIHVLELPKFTKAIHEVSTPLERWMYSLCHARSLTRTSSRPSWRIRPSDTHWEKCR